MERVGVLHQEFSRAHDAEAGPDFVAHLVLYLIQIQRQLFIAADFVAHDVGDDFFVRRAQAKVALLAVADAQQFRAVLIPAARLLPQLGRLHHGHGQLQRPGRIHLLAHHALDFAQHSQPQGQPGVQARTEPADHPRAQHQAMADDLCVRRGFPVRGQQELGAAHGDGFLDKTGAGSVRPCAGPVQRPRLSLAPSAWRLTLKIQRFFTDDG